VSGRDSKRRTSEYKWDALLLQRNCSVHEWEHKRVDLMKSWRNIIMISCTLHLVLSSFIHHWLYGPRTPWTSDQSVAMPLPTHRTTRTQNKHTQTSMSWVGFEPKIPAFEPTKTVYAADRDATPIGSVSVSTVIKSRSIRWPDHVARMGR
jgi:hypothetical protein